MTDILKYFSDWHNRRQFILAAIDMSTREKNVAAFPSVAVVLGVACAALSLLIASIMWQRAGNPAVVLVWLASAAGIFAYARVHRRWRASLERIASQRPAMPLWRARGKGNEQAEEVAFVDIPRRKTADGLILGPESMTI